ncbi:MAG: hypothetical protein ACRDJE_18095, partial [Dehalococcoidia bacterium]
MTPIRRQYLDVKRRFPDTVVLFRLGDFYETFDEDADLCARVLNLTLTSRPLGKGERVPMAGIPHHPRRRACHRSLMRHDPLPLLRTGSLPRLTQVAFDSSEPVIVWFEELGEPPPQIARVKALLLDGEDTGDIHPIFGPVIGGLADDQVFG